VEQAEQAGGVTAWSPLSGANRRATVSRRALLVGSGAVALAGLDLSRPGGLQLPVAGAQANPIVLENQLPGTRDWQLRKRAGNTGAILAAYARQGSVAAGQTVEIAVHTGAEQAVSAKVYRVGWYGSLGGRLVQDLGSTTVAPQPAPAIDAVTGEITCPWAVAFRWTVPAGHVSGVHVVRLVRADGYDTWAMFTVRDDRPAAFVYHQPTTTYAAYNCFPDDGVSGKCLYGFGYGENTITGGRRAVHVSFDRPHQGDGSGTFFYYEADLVRWLEQQGYDLTYATVQDVHSGLVRLRDRVGVISAGHDEYWSDEVWDAFHDARERGVNLFFGSANSAYWRIRFEPAADGRPHRRVVAWKESAGIDPGTPTTGLFRRHRAPEQTLVGVQYTKWGDQNTPFVPANADHWVWQGSGAQDGVALPTNIVGYEVDIVDPGAPLPANTEFTVLGRSPYVAADGSRPVANATIYRYAGPNGLRPWVFATGTISWAWGLGRSGYTNTAIQQATKNVLDRFLLDAGAPPPPTTTTSSTTTSTTMVVPPPTTTTTTTTSTTTTTTEPTDAAGAGPFAPFIDARAFVAQQYRDLLAREADPSGLSYWTGVLAPDGSNRSRLVEGFIGSGEFAPWYQVARLYQAVFARIPDPGGYRYWFGRYTRGEIGLAEMAAHFVASPEWTSLYGPITNADLVTLVYRNLFQRAPDPEGGAYWTAQLDRGMSRATFVLGFSESTEFRNRYREELDVIALWQGLLRRPPSPQEFRDAVARLETGLRTTRGEIDTLLASAEYRQRFA
jgi:hypothetical protein